MAEVLCGNDPHAFPKPDPRNIHYICDKLKIDVKSAVMVGDTTGLYSTTISVIN